ncbi:hypothetical protein [Streptomyces sp. NPDC045251]|uniref:hypothetical protein n=1 Tax=unclassified Streptomyces TaxID=2593676 RepID=UPI0033F2844D
MSLTEANWSAVDHCGFGLATEQRKEGALIRRRKAVRRGGGIHSPQYPHRRRTVETVRRPVIKGPLDSPVKTPMTLTTTAHRG